MTIISHLTLFNSSCLTIHQRNPFFQKNFLTVGDWSAKIWSEDVRSPLVATRHHTASLTDGCWSPVRPAVFLTGKADGTMDVWDILFKQSAPTLSVQVTTTPIQALRVQEHGRVVAVAARDGSTTLLELSESLTRIQGGEKATFSQMLERETKREKTLEAAAREKRLKAQQGKRPLSGALIDQIPPDVAKATEEEFMGILEEEKTKLAKAKGTTASPATADAA
jgi:dynein intermediate chain 2